MEKAIEHLQNAHAAFNEVERGHFETYNEAFQQLGSGLRSLTAALLEVQTQATQAAIIEAGKQ